jgi:hypothetical protein
MDVWYVTKLVRIPIQVLESYDFTTLQHHVDPNPTMNPNLVESMLSPDPNHRILYNIAKSRSCLWTLSILTISWVILITTVRYYVNLPSHFHLPHNPLFTSQALNDQPIGSFISFKNPLQYQSYVLFLQTLNS